MSGERAQSFVANLGICLCLAWSSCLRWGFSQPLGQCWEQARRSLIQITPRTMSSLCRPQKRGCWGGWVRGCNGASGEKKGGGSEENGNPGKCLLTQPLQLLGPPSLPRLAGSWGEVPGLQGGGPRVDAGPVVSKVRLEPPPSTVLPLRVHGQTRFCRDRIGGSFHFVLSTEQCRAQILNAEETGLGGRGAGGCAGWDLLSRPLSSGNVSFSPPSQLIN